MAISFGAALGRANAAGAASISLTGLSILGSDPFLVAAVALESSTPLVSSFNWDDGAGGSAQAMTIINSTQVVEAPNFRMYFYGLKNPNTSNSRIIASFDASTNIQMGAVYYAGVDQTTPTADEDGVVDAATGADIVNTSNLNGSWQLVAANSPYGTLAVTANGTEREQVSVANAVYEIFDSNAGVDSGSNATMSFTWAAAHPAGFIFCMIRPSSAAATASGSLLTMGIGN